MNASNFNQFTDDLDKKLSSPERQGKTAQKRNKIAKTSTMIMTKAD